MRQYRHEIKMSINAFDKAILISRLSHGLKRDQHAENGGYVVRSLYFDDCNDSAVQEKLMGVLYREKFRIRTYGSLSVIKLEKKVKDNYVGYKESAPLTRNECRRILQNDCHFLKNRSENVCRQFYSKVSTGIFKPKSIIQYYREAFIWDPGRVRITIDSQIQAGLGSTDFLNFAVPLTGVLDQNTSILEIKYDDFLPAHVSNLLQIDSRKSTALSKYVMSRCYG